MELKRLGMLFSLAIAVTASATTPKQAPTQDIMQRSAWWREAKFGMFIHWGIYSVPADSTDLNGNKGVGEWYFSNKHAQVADYEKFAGQFNPTKFDAHTWVKIAKDAGMRYIVITTKHHDGFDMFDSKLSDYTITKATPFKLDPMKELAAECKKQGIVLCFYHSIMDWHHPDYLPRRPWDVRPVGDASLDKYIAYMEGQLKELLTNYGPVGLIWFDGGWEHNTQELHSQEVVSLIHSLQPNTLINDRIDLPEDYSTPEQRIPATGLPGGRLWETCMTMNDTWGYARNDDNWKSTDLLIHNLCDIASKGGNFLLNVGPMATGEIPPASVDRLAEVGKWMRTNSKAIYGTTHSPWKRLSFDGRCTVKGKSLYLEVFKWPAEGLALQGLDTKVVSARALAGNEHLKVQQDGGIVTVSKPDKLDPTATVIELRLSAPPQVTEAVTLIKPQADGSFLLKAADADIHGTDAQYESGDANDNIGYWHTASDYVTWDCQVPAAGTYKVAVKYAAEPAAAGNEFTVSIGDQTLTGKIDSTGGWTTFVELALDGTVKLPAGKTTIKVSPKTIHGGGLMNLRSVTLTPGS